jgi:hypothetical protein
LSIAASDSRIAAASLILAASGQIQNIENWCIRVDRERLIEGLM